LVPLAPIIVRSGRPFDEQAGVDPPRFPPPSTVAGCLRTAHARQANLSFGLALADIAVAGPLLMREAEDGTASPLVPKPADALYFGHGGAATCMRAEPRPFPAGCGADLPAGLMPVQLDESGPRGKPGDGPDWWAWDDLLAFRSGDDPPEMDRLRANGLERLQGELRTHVAIDRRRRAAASAQLFQTHGLDLEPENRGLAAARPCLRLLARCEQPLAADLVHLGGERRLAQLDPLDGSSWPEPPSGWFDAIRKAGGLSLTLLTSGLFGAGWRPTWFEEHSQAPPPEFTGLQLRLRAAALERWQPHSGWDLAGQRPRAARKLIPAGAVYWVELHAEPDDDILRRLWLGSICDDLQDRRDGFGLTLPAPWSVPTQATI
jgi:CRISPR-associated protein Cmr3